MKFILSILLLSMAVPGCQVTGIRKESEPMSTNSSEENDRKAAELVVRQYMELLHAADTDGIMKLYDDDAVFLPADRPTAAGKSRIRETYVAIFKHVNFPEGESTTEEVTIHGNLAIVRLATKATVLILAKNERTSSTGREFFVLTRVDGSFKISRYMFNRA
jgi:uncharacterized protein (TIGR02246 family)